MTLLRGLADDLRLDVWLMGYMMPVEREFVSPESVRLGTLLACAEQIRSGVTTCNNMYYFEEDVAKAAAEAGMRAICGQTVMKFPTPDAASYEDSLQMAREFIQRWKDHPLIVPAVAPHAPYTCTAEILQATAELAREFDVPLHTHLAETAFEVENMRNEHDKPVIPYVKKQGLFDAKVIAAHCVHVDTGEIRTMLHAGAGVCHNPSSNLKLASGFAPVMKMLETGLNVGIGTDGPASNNDLDMFEEVRLAAFVAKAVTNDPTSLPAPWALMMATRLGAQALHIGHLTGSLEPGKRADLILVDISPLHNSPSFKRAPDNAYAQLVYAGKSTDVSDVMVNGQWLMRDHRLLTVHEEELLAQATEIAKKIDAFLSFDGPGIDRITHRALGSRRYRVEFAGPGGHSWGDFGVPNPVHAIGRAISRLAGYPAPKDPRATFNVGRIEGGTSINYIPGKATMEVDLRSASATELRRLDAFFRRAIADAVDDENSRRRAGDAQLKLILDMIGERPTAKTPRSIIDASFLGDRSQQ